MARKKNKAIYDIYYSEMTGEMFPVKEKSKPIVDGNLVFQPIDKDSCKLIKYKSLSKIKKVLEIPDKVKGMNVISIGDKAFSSIEGLKKVVLPNNLIEICPRAFGWCLDLSEINLPETLKYIGYWAFESCYKLFNNTNIFDMPDNLEIIGISAFSDCHDIHKIILGRNLKYIGNAGFSGCFNLKYVSFEKNRTARLGRGVFYNCTQLKTTSDDVDMSII